MANISTYPLGTPKSTDMLAGTAVNVEQTDGTKVNLTRNFTVSSVAAFADATAAYTAYTIIFGQTGSAAPTVDQLLQNTTGATFTWARTGAGTYTVTASSALFLEAKTICFLNNGGVTDSQNIQWTRTSNTVLTITTSADAKITKGSFEVRIYS
jgi:hypothetical protein